MRTLDAIDAIDAIRGAPRVRSLLRSDTMEAMKPRSIACVVLAVLAAACGKEEQPAPFAPWNANLPPELREGKWSKPQSERAPQLSEEQLRTIAELEAIGYADGVVSAPELVSVTIHDRARAHEGLNFYTSGHAPEAYLVDMEGEVLHVWSHPYEGLWPELDVPPDAAGREKWRRARLLADGSILAIHEGLGMIKLDVDSHLLWQYPGRTHHDLDVLADGTIWTLGREAKLIPRIDPEVPCMDDFLVELSPEGVERRRISVLECLENGGADELLARMPHRRELFHTNSIEMLDGRLAESVPAFAAGNLLISLRHLDAIAVVDPERRAVVWWLTGRFLAQHDPTVLDDGNLLLFDNRGGGEASAVLELDPLTGDERWSYRGSAEEPFFSNTCGTAYRLAGGNTLINESDGGRSFEVLPDGTIVWEYFNPHRGGPNLEYIACLYDLVRLDPAFVEPWLGERHRR